MANAKPTRKQLRDRADRLCGSLVRSRNRCELAGVDRIRCGGPFQWAHIIGRSNYRLRWETYNALCLCAGHHVYYTHHPWEWQELIREHFPENYDLITKHRNEIWDKQIEAVIEKLKQETQNGENSSTSAGGGTA